MSEWQPDIDRFLTAIRHQESDRVPLAEFNIDEPLLDKILGRPATTVEDHVAALAASGHDYIYLRADYDFPGAAPAAATGTPRSWAWVRSRSGESDDVTKDGPLHTAADLDSYPWPDPEAVDIAHFARAAAALPARMGIVTGVGGIFTRTWMTMGYEHFCLSLADDPALVARIAERVGRIQAAVLRRLMRLPGVAAVWYGDDLAYTEGLMAPSEVLRRVFFPWIEELAGIARQARMPFVMHSDGCLYQVLDDLIALGVQAIHPIEAKAMDIHALRDRYRSRLALFGNIDLGYALTAGTGRPEDVRTEVRRKIRDLAPGGGYGVASGGGATRYVSLENYLAMRDATREFGGYPIRC